jgi:hypothetical protein
MIDMYIYIYIYPKYGLIQTLRFNRQTCGIVGIEWDFFYDAIMDKNNFTTYVAKITKEWRGFVPREVGI